MENAVDFERLARVRRCHPGLTFGPTKHWQGLVPSRGRGPYTPSRSHHL